MRVMNSCQSRAYLETGSAHEPSAQAEPDAGVNEAVAYLYLNGEMRRVGTYGSTSSPAAHKDDTFFSGTGVLTVLYDVSGTLIKVR